MFSKRSKESYAHSMPTKDRCHPNSFSAARNKFLLYVLFKVVFCNSNTHLDTGLHFTLHTVQYGAWHAFRSIRNTVSNYLQCWWMGGIHCLIHLQRKSSIGSGQVKVDPILCNHHTCRLVAGMCPECIVEHLIPCRRGAIMLEPYIQDITQREVP